MLYLYWSKTIKPYSSKQLTTIVQTIDQSQSLVCGEGATQKYFFPEYTHLYIGPYCTVGQIKNETPLFILIQIIIQE